MFMCKKCHPAKCFSPFLSQGACEVCGRVAICYDCHDITHTTPPEKSEKKEHGKE